MDDTPVMDDAAPVRRRRKRLWLLPLAVFGLCAATVLAFELRGAGWLMPVVAGKVEAASGLRFTAVGPASASVVPRLGLRAADVQLTPAGPGAAPLLHADAADIELSWPALLRGQIAIARLRLVRSRLLAAASLPPGDVDVAVDGSAVVLRLSSGEVNLDAAAHRDGDTLAVDRLTVHAGGLVSAAGSGRLSLRDPIRLVLNAALRTADRPAGAVAAALTYSADGLVLERANWHRPDGLDVELFGHAAPADGALRFEGGLAGASDVDKDFVASAAFDGALGADGLSVALANIDVRAAGSHLTGEAKLQPGRLAAALQVDRVDVAAIGKSPLAPLAAGAAALDADATFHVRIDAIVNGAGTIGEGIVVDASRHAGTFDLHELAVRSLGGVPLEASGRLALGPAPVAAFDPVHLRYGDVEANGRLTLDASGPRPSLAGEIATGPLLLDKLFAGPPPPRPEPMTRRALAAAKAQPPAAAAWSTAPVAIPIALPFDADVTFAAPRLVWRSTQLADVHSRLQVREHAVAMTGLTASAYGGRLAFNGRIEQASLPHLTVGLTLAGADLGAVLADLGVPDTTVRGDVSAELAADGSSAADIVGTLSGTITLANGSGTVTGVDLATLSERLKQRSTRPADVLQLARAAGGGRTSFSDLHGHFRVDRGTASTDDLQLTAATAAARARGSIDLKRQALDVVSEFQLTDPAGVPPLVVKLDGPFAAPRRVFDISRLQSYLLHGRDAQPAARPR